MRNLFRFVVDNDEVGNSVENLHPVTRLNAFVIGFGELENLLQLLGARLGSGAHLSVCNRQSAKTRHGGK